MKPYIHAQNSVAKWQGSISDYLPVHDWFDQAKGHYPSQTARCVLHSSLGIYIAEQVFGHILVNSDGKEVSIRDLGEQHLLEDLGCIPTLGDYLMNMTHQPWMGGEGYPPSVEAHLNNKKVQKSPIDPEKIILDGLKPKLDTDTSIKTRYLD